LQAAVLLAKLDVFDEELAARERIATIYDRHLADLVATPARVPDSESAWAIYAVLLAEGVRDDVQAMLKAEGVPTAVYYPKPLHHQPAYRPSHTGNPLPVSESLATRILALPIHPDLTQAQAQRVCDAMMAALA
jgi:dTDP-4-amino-4,6-dideoxygalactose transaminase